MYENDPDERLVEHVSAILVRRNPAVPADEVEAMVREELHRLDGCAVREHCATLVEHAVRDRLRRRVKAPA